MKKKLYNVRFSRGGPSMADVDFSATSDHAATGKVTGIAREVGLPNTPCALYCKTDHRMVDGYIIPNKEAA